jgi:hypothetical protein
MMNIGCHIRSYAFANSFTQLVLEESKSLTKKFPAFCGSKKLITVLAKACHWALS